MDGAGPLAWNVRYNIGAFDTRQYLLRALPHNHKAQFKCESHKFMYEIASLETARRPS